MTVSYLIRYVGQAKDMARFLEYYRTRHAALMREYPGIRACKLHHPVEWKDSVPVNEDHIMLLVELVFDSREALHAALHSPVRERTRADFFHLKTLIDAEVKHLAVETEVVFSQ